METQSWARRDRRGRPNPVHRAELHGRRGRPAVHLPDRQAGPAGRRCGDGCIGDTMVLATATASQSVARGNRLLPAVGGSGGAAVCRWPHPGLVLPPRGPAQRGGHPHGPAHRSATQAAVPQGLPQRRTDHRHRPVERWTELPGHSGPGRCQRGADDQRHSLPRARRRLPRRAGGRTSSSSTRRPRRWRPAASTSAWPALARPF